MDSKHIALVFDVETTGLLPKRPSMNGPIAPPIPIEEYPYITQFSFILYDLKTEKILSCYDSFINIPENIIIPPEVVELTGIENHMCHSPNGESIVNALVAFYEAYKQCHYLVAHNIYFDTEMISVEIERNRDLISVLAPQCFTLLQPVYERLNNIERYCTMRKGINICNLVVPGENGRPPRKKFPKLGELHSSLFEGEVVNGLHNSFIDVTVCLKCFIEILRRGSCST